MSSFLHNPTQFKSVANYLILNGFESKTDLNLIFKTLFAISAEAVGKQYGDFDSKELREDIKYYEKDNMIVNLNDMACLKAVASISYQIELDKITNNSTKYGYSGRELTELEKESIEYLRNIETTLLKLIGLKLNFDISKDLEKKIYALPTWNSSIGWSL